MEPIEPNNKEVKDLLFENYRYYGESIRKNEESGETRVNFYITILAALPVAVVALADKGPGSILESADVRNMLFITLTSFFIFGIFIFLRLLKRNKITDDLKFALDNVRQQYKDIYDPSCFLHYGIFPKRENPMVSLQERESLKVKNESRGWGSLAHIVALLNAMVIGSISFIIAHKNINTAFAIATIVFIWALLIHKYVIVSREKKVQAKIKSNLFTHAGGIVFRRVPTENPTNIEYLVVTNKAENQEKVGKKYIFPRGHIEKDEEVSQCALREVYEETGVIAHIIKPAGFYYDHDQPVHKVRLYLMESLSRGESSELREKYWLSFEKAYEILSFPVSKAIMVQVHSFLLSNNFCMSSEQKN